MPEGRGRDDLDLHATGAYVLDRVGDEPPRSVVRPAGIGRRQHENLQRRLAKTTGSASASATNA